MTDLAVYQPSAAVAVPDAHDTDSWITVAQDVIKIANVIFDTPFVPDGLRGNAPAVAACMLAGREMGLSIMTSLANIDVIKGKPTQKALLMRALIQSRGHKWEDVEVTDTRAVIRACRKGESTWAEVMFTADQAKKAGIDLGKYPADKLYARATSRLARRKFADVIMGMPYSAEELEDGEADEGTVAETAAPSNDHAPAEKPRTAQRRQRPTAAKPANGSASTASPAAPQAAPSEGLPPLPGEDEPGPTQPGSSSAGQGHPQPGTSPPSASSRSSSGPGEPLATGGQVGIIQSHFKRLGFEGHDRDERLVITAQIAGLPEGHDLGSTKELTQEQASAVADTLSRCKDRVRLMALVTKQEDGQDG
jgi:hypothetical protein